MSYMYVLLLLRKKIVYIRIFIPTANTHKLVTKNQYNGIIGYIRFVCNTKYSLSHLYYYY